MFNNIKMVSFDLWQTLIKSNPAYKSPRTLLIAKFFNYKGELGWLYENIIAKVNLATDKLIDTDGIPRGLHYRLVKMYQLLHSCEAVPFSAKDVETFSEKLCKIIAAHPPLLIEGDTITTIEALKSRGVKTAVISNSGLAESNHMQIALKAIGLDKCMDHILYSHEEGISKPNPALFLKLSTVSNIAPNTILHIGDNEKADYCGAVNAGFQAIMFKNANNQFACTNKPSVSSIKSLLTLLN